MMGNSISEILYLSICAARSLVARPQPVGVTALVWTTPKYNYRTVISSNRGRGVVFTIFNEYGVLVHFCAGYGEGYGEVYFEAVL